MAKLTYCSFADEEKCRGVLVLLGELSPVQAAVTAHALKQNPGGQLAAFSFDTDDPDCPRDVAAALLANTGRLLTAEESMRLFEGVDIATAKEEGLYDKLIHPGTATDNA